MSVDNSIPAFARPAAWSPGGANMINAQNGMTLRDYFAAKALTGIAADSFEEVAKLAYQVADAMLTERAK